MLQMAILQEAQRTAALDGMNAPMMSACASLFVPCITVAMLPCVVHVVLSNEIAQKEAAVQSELSSQVWAPSCGVMCHD